MTQKYIIYSELDDKHIKNVLLYCLQNMTLIIYKLPIYLDIMSKIPALLLRKHILLLYKIKKSWFLVYYL